MKNNARKTMKNKMMSRKEKITPLKINMKRNLQDTVQKKIPKLKEKSRKKMS